MAKKFLIIVTSLCIAGYSVYAFFPKSFMVVPTSGSAPLEIGVYVQDDTTGMAVNFGDGSSHSHWSEDVEGDGRYYMRHLYQSSGEYTLRLLKDGKEVKQKKIVVE